jgi:two-component system LytT family sensor kinase
VSWATEPVENEAAATTQVTVVTVDPPTYVLRVGQLTGGRRLLSDDHALLDAVAATAARRIDQLRLTTERYEVKLREEEMLKLTAEAELKALRAQINPHFLFNALTTIGYLIESAPPRALSTLLQLTALMRGVLRSDGEFTTLGREIDLIQHYLKIEQERFEERLFVRIDVPNHLRNCRIPALVLQPLVENAVKHGIAPSRIGGDVEISAGVVQVGPDKRLRLTVRNSGEPLTDVTSQDLHEHLGVDNVQRRLAGHFGTQAVFSLTRRPDHCTVAEIIMPLPFEALEEDDRDAQALAHRAGR